MNVKGTPLESVHVFTMTVYPTRPGAVSHYERVSSDAKSESVLHGLRGISQFAMKVFLQLKRSSGQRLDHCSSKSAVHPSITRSSLEGLAPKFKLPLGCPGRQHRGSRQIRNNGSASFRCRRRGRFCVSSSVLRALSLSPSQSRSSPLFDAAIRASFIWNEMSFLVIIVVAGKARHGTALAARGTGRDPDLPPRRRAVPDAI